ncbi:HIT domain-containing protein [Photobacterium sp. TY1-4]|uniref:HIT domain-containing protein n=1 Tax=Photobacterium sp. TY1-4 TaxID=2899122 RepID=UPI0021C22342|nr:HIT domain-containing protein [Photobacterium sp. TY1-4]UXI02098.1 HIT domain-containing protein [Photobacterium sp. TY1-4]
MQFSLHPRLAADTTLLGDLPLCQVLLSKEALGPWLILVPRREALTEIHHLPEADQFQLMRESSAVAALLEQDYQADKINVGALGNLVPQLHVHHIARFKTDMAWPGPVWGNTDGAQRNEAVQTALAEELRDELSSIPGFTPST